jgi:hypothetical protein
VGVTSDFVSASGSDHIASAVFPSADYYRAAQTVGRDPQEEVSKNKTRNACIT